MNASAQLPMIATATFQRLLFCLAEGLALAVLVSGVLRLAPGKDSRTRFLVWFSALLATATLPLLTAEWQSLPPLAGAPQSLISIPLAVVEGVCAAWLVMAMMGLLRVAFGLKQIRRLRDSCQPVRAGQLGPELASRVEEFRKVRPVSILVSQDVHVPAAVGFFKPAIVLPAWLADEGPSGELKHVVLHELEHLRRYDDWTNLAQQIVKSVLFFHPAVWWMEREMALDREMACDDAVLAQTASPRAYAECLARVAERSFLRRQMALAQAAVSRVRQLSQRVARILDPDRPAAARLWKPAVPVVAALALLCAVGLSWTPGLIAVNSGAASTTTAAVTSGVPMKLVVNTGADTTGFSAMGVHAARVSVKHSPNMQPMSIPAALRSGFVPAKAIPAKAIQHPSQKQKPVLRSQTSAEKNRIAGLGEDKGTLKTGLADHGSLFAKNGFVAENGTVQETRTPDPAHAATENVFPAAGVSEAAFPEAQGDYVLVVASERTVTQGPRGVQVNVVEVRMLVPASEFRKQFPKKI